MGTWGWLADNSFNLLTFLTGIGGLWFAGFSIYAGVKAQRVANLLTITANHRDIWTFFIFENKVKRIRDVSANLIEQPITEAERAFVAIVIAHINSVFYAMNNQLVMNWEGLRRDVAQFLSLPIPSAVWEKIRFTQNSDFVAFIDSCLKG